MSKQSEEIHEMDVQEAKAMIEQGNVLIVDVRSPMDYEISNIEGAIHLTPSDFDEFVNTTDKSVPVLCYCYFGNSSMSICVALKEYGFAKPINLKGGFDAWQKAA